MNDILLEIDNLNIRFNTPRGDLRVVNNVSFQIRKGEIFGLVGESGCGKSVISLAILQLIPKSGQISQGDIIFRGDNLLQKSAHDMQRIRGADIAMIFQDPFSSLNPVFRVGQQLFDVLKQHQKIDGQSAKERILTLFDTVGLPDVKRIYNSYPHELSGGQQQRVMIAMALLSEPSLIIADEPTTALDVTIQAQILRLLRKLCDERGISVLLITHDLAVIADVCDRVAVLYAGKVVETAPTKELLTHPIHPYTEGLLAAIPRAKHKGQKLHAIPGTVPPNPGAIQGCVFNTRCDYVVDRCKADVPQLVHVAHEHQSACFIKGDSV